MTIIFAIILSLITGIVIGRWFAPVNTVVEYVEYDIRPAQILKDNVFPIRGREM